MKSLFAFTLVFIALPLCAQTAAPTAPAAAPADAAAPATSIPANVMNTPLFSTLTDAEKTQFGNAYTKAMTNDPDLQKDQMALMQKGLALRASGTEPTDAEKKAMHDEAKAFYDKLRAAMIKADPTLPPVLAKVDEQTEKMKAQMQAGH